MGGKQVNIPTSVFPHLFAVRRRLARKITTIKASERPTNPGTPTSSANPVCGKPEAVGVTVPRAAAAWVNRAATVAVRGSWVGDTSTSVGAASTGVTLAVGGTLVAVGVAVKLAT